MPGWLPADWRDTRCWPVEGSKEAIREWFYFQIETFGLGERDIPGLTAHRDHPDVAKWCDDTMHDALLLVAYLVDVEGVDMPLDAAKRIAEKQRPLVALRALRDRLFNAISPKAPAPVAGEQGEGTGKPRDEILKSLSLCVRQAYLAYHFAETKNGKRLKDQEAYDCLHEYGLPDNAGDLGELCDYELPGFDTWARYLGEARAALGEQKYTRRANRSKGRSIANADQVASPERDE